MTSAALLLLAAFCSVDSTIAGLGTRPPTTVPARSPDGKRYLSQPLTTAAYTADPAAKFYNGRVYVYVSHDTAEGPSLPDVEPFKGSKGNGYRMIDYLVLSLDPADLDKPNPAVTVHEPILKLTDVPWAARQLWAPDVIFKNDTYYLYFPAKAHDGPFRIGVATSKTPEGPFTAQSTYIPGSYSIDPAIFTDDDNASYIIFGGLSGGQLQMNLAGTYNANASSSDPAFKDPSPKAAIGPRIARLSDNMLEFVSAPQEIIITDQTGKPIAGNDGNRKFFEGAFLHKYNNTYYLSYSTGGTHLIAYATSKSPLGPYLYQGTLLHPVQGWTTHHSILKVADKWYLFYADSQISTKNNLRNVKVTELQYNADGTIKPIDPFLPGEATP